MPPALLGLHHVTATVTDAQDDLEFCAGALGLRLVKKTVNFDNPHVYHFYYGDERGTPGTIWTTFPYKGHGVREGRDGAGMVVTTSFAVGAGALPAWADRLARAGVAAAPAEPRFGEDVLTVSDRSGLTFEIIGTSRDARAPWTGRVADPAAAIRGIHSVTLAVRDAGRTAAFMNEVLGFTVVGEAGGRTRVAAGGDAPGHTVDILHLPNATPGLNGLGTVHHVAFAIATSAEQLEIREHLVRLGVQVTPVRDRCYFTSIYFREPGGVLFEIATVAPGFTADEALADLGQGLKLPPWEEASRRDIEAGLPSVITPASPATAR